ncbi:hypothetical protein FRC00_004580 [Tulasnella sp. 408]|nr:hypothetical protein FRC00_004580 [Tulasnella sp. 408]
MQDLSFDASELVTSALPVLPHLEFLEVPPDHRIFLIAPSTLYELLSKTPNLKQAAIGVEASRGDPGDAIPALAHMERVGQGLFEILHKSSMPLRDLTLTYVPQWRQPSWSPDDLKLVARYLPELEILRLKIRGHKVDGLQEALFYISQLQKLRIISFSTSDKPGMVDSSGTQDDIWQESKLREFLGLTRSPVLERVGFGEEREWKLEDTGVWMLWQGGRMVRSVSL